MRSKQAIAPIVLADLSTQAGIELLMQWLSNPNVVGIFLAPPCGSASRARSIPVKRKRPGDPEPPRPLRSNQYPNGLPFLCFVDRLKISKANKLYHLTAKLIQWAVEEDCLLVVENPQFSFFWQTSFIQAVVGLMDFTVFQSCHMAAHAQSAQCLVSMRKNFDVSIRCAQVSPILTGMSNGACLLPPTNLQLQWRRRTPSSWRSQ